MEDLSPFFSDVAKNIGLWQGVAAWLTTFFLFFLQLEHRDVAASQTLRAALSKVESTHPGFSYDLVLGLVKKADVAVNMNESLLRLQGSIAEQDSKALT